jgi:hypothetical protein
MTDIVLYDGQTYGRELGRISPEGNRYGQLRMIRDVFHYHFWDGEEWNEVPEALDQADSYDLLPTNVEHAEVWRVRRYNDARKRYVWDYWFWNSGTSSWKLIKWCWTVDQLSDLPTPGHFIGEGHRVLESDILAKWTGYEWERAVTHSGLEDNEPARHVPVTFAQDYANQVSDTHGRIVTVNNSLLSHASDNVNSFNQVYFDLDEMDEDIATMEETVQTFSNLVTELDESFQELDGMVNTWNSNEYMTLAESNALKTAEDQLLSESAEVIGWATALGITTEATQYQDALDALDDVLQPWFDAPPYPKAISAAQRTAIAVAFNNVVDKKSALVKAIDDATIDGVYSYFGSRISEAVVEFKSKTTIGVYGSVKGSSGAIWCSGELLLTDLVDDVANDLPVLNYTANTIVPTHIEPETEYYIYIANHVSSAFSVASLPADGDKPSTPATDFRGNLFLSQTPDVNGLLGSSGVGVNARIVGKCETDSTSYALGGPYFIREINMSLIGREADLSDAFTEYSDFQVTFVDQNTLSFTKFDGTRGLCYVAGELLNLGTGLQLTTSDNRISWVGGDPPIELDETAISNDTLYNIYLSNDADDFNFNATDPATQRPYQEGSPNYIEAKDLRRSIFLSTKTHDHRLLDEAYPGYMARHIGQVRTDNAGYFRYASDISLIRQLTLNPTYLDGMAEAHIVLVNTTSFKVAKNKGTTGIVMVGGLPVSMLGEEDAGVHLATNSMYVKAYTESEPSSPLSDGSAVSSFPSDTLYLYLANSLGLWGDVASDVFWCQVAPTNGYLSQNWPGNNARWICTAKTNSIGQFSGDYILDAISPIYTRIDDSTVSRSLTWSSEKIALQVAIAAQGSAGIPIRLEYYDTSMAILKPTQGTNLELKFRDESTYTVAASGISVYFSGQSAGLKYLYINNTGTVYFSTSQWNYAAANVRYLDNDILVGIVGITSTGAVSGDWNIVSAMNHQKRTYNVYDPQPSVGGNPINTTITKNLNGLVIDNSMTVTALAEGTLTYSYFLMCSNYCHDAQYHTASGTLMHAVNQPSASWAVGLYGVVSNASITIPGSPQALTYYSSWAPVISVSAYAYSSGCCQWQTQTLTKTSSSAKITITIE